MNLRKWGLSSMKVTTTREILDFDYDAGEITYSEYDSFEWCETCTWIDDNGDSHNSVPGSTEITQVNILWNTQRIAGISTGIIYGEVFAKAGFANNMIANDLQNRAPSIWAAEDISGMVMILSKFATRCMDKVNAAILAPSCYSRPYVSDNWNSSSGHGCNNTQISSLMQIQSYTQQLTLRLEFVLH